MQAGARAPFRTLVSPLPSPTLSQADSNFSLSKYANQGPPQAVPSGNSGQYMRDVHRRPPGQGSGMTNGNAHGESTRSSRDSSERVRLSGEEAASANLAKLHWETFHSFLSNGENQSHPRQNKAREKLTRLNRIQFQELSTDVYDEVQRRTQRAHEGLTALPATASFHPKRNQAREKLSSLQNSRFKDLASDVFFEIERRYPVVQSSHLNGDSVPQRDIQASSAPRGLANGGQDAQTLRQLGKQPNVFRQTAVIPNKSVMMEDDIESEYESDLKSPRTNSDLHSNHDTEPSLKPVANKPIKSTAGLSLTQDRVPGTDAAAAAAKIAELTDKVASLESRLQQANESSLIENQRSQDLQKGKERHVQIEAELRRLQEREETRHESSRSVQEQNEQLKRDLEEQKLLTNQVRTDAERFLEEMQAISDGEAAHHERAAGLTQRVRNLEDELKEWKERFHTLRLQITQATGPSKVSTPTLVLDEVSSQFLIPGGQLPSRVIAIFQTSINTLLQLARTEIPRLSEAMEDVVLAIKSIQTCLNSLEAPLARDERISVLRQKLANTTNNLTRACRNHVYGGILSPVSLVDAAASHVSNTVVELAKICKVAPASLDDIDTHQHAQSPIKGRLGTLSDISHDRRHGSSFDGADLQTIVKQGDLADSTSEIRVFLESQTEAIVSSIQTLLSAIRSEANTLSVLHSHMDDVVTVVTRVTSTIRHSCETDRAFLGKADGILRALESCSTRIKEMARSSDGKARGNQVQSSKEFKQKLAGIAYDTAKQTKELSMLLQESEEPEVDLT